MTAAANLVCYIQPITTDRAESTGTVWVDTSKTAVLRRRVGSLQEAEAFFAEARETAKALGGTMCLKKIVQTAPSASRAPAHVKRLQGNEVING